MNIVQIDPTLPFPEYHTPGAVGFDLIARVDVTVPARGIALVPNNIIVQVPEGSMLMICSRSSTLKKTGLMVGNGVGIIDQDYHGPEDELMTLFYNTTDQDVHIHRGDRYSQAVLVSVGKPELIRSQVQSDTSRGGFGTTGHR